MIQESEFVLTPTFGQNIKSENNMNKTKIERDRRGGGGYPFLSKLDYEGTREITEGA